MNNLKLLTAGTLGLALLLPLGAQANKPVGITGDTMAVTVMHNGSATDITRNQDNANTVNPAFGKPRVLARRSASSQRFWPRGLKPSLSAK